ncbi:MAG: ABC transporter permease [Propionibacteriaceae bacterium]|jgi:peptide/nickel transport system permease protein|nr:ABC transporter permease [Propionibacteriaceae bacterium]
MTSKVVQPAWSYHLDHTWLPAQTELIGVVDDSKTEQRRRGWAIGRLIGFRLAQAVFVLWAAITVTFVAVHLMPGDTVSLLLGENRNDEVLRASTISRWGLDQPIWLQYLIYLRRIPTGDLGTSYTLRKPVGELIGELMGPTFQLAATALVCAIVIGFLLAYATTGRTPLVRPIVNTLELVFLSAPPFWIGIVLLAVFSFRLGWFSVIDYTSWESLVLPVAAIALPMGFYLAQVLRDGIDRALEQPFSLTARTRGLTWAQVRSHHALRHASLPAISLIGLIAGGLLGGAVITETVFARPGLGQIAVSGVQVKDIPLILGIALVTTFAYVVASTVADLVGILLDPRLRAGGKA